MNRSSKLAITALSLTMTACANMPNGPSVMVLPGSSASFDQFRVDDANCQQFAMWQLGGTTPNQAATNSGIGTAAVGTALGAATGAAIGGGSGAAIGAGAGLAAGGIAGSGTASSSYYANQRQYDVAYIQCMYSKGHRVPVSGQFSAPAPASTTPSPAASHIPPPPPGSPPPPPPVK
jgi:hypothetical protein